MEIIRSEGKASTSFLQRKLQIGYNRAARIIDMMEADGIVSKANHVGKRDMASPFSLEEKQVLLEANNLTLRKNKIAEILSTYTHDVFNNTTIQ